VIGVGFRLVVLGGVLSLLVPVAEAADASGLDVTIEVLGRDDRVDERIVNRIQVPGVGGDLSRPLAPRQSLGGTLGNTVSGVTDLVDGVVDGVAPLVPLLRYEEWLQQRREADQDRQRESR
jgi:hypothetical protein